MNLSGQSLRNFLTEGASLEKKMTVVEFDNPDLPSSVVRTIIEEQYKMTIYGDRGEDILGSYASNGT